MGANIQSGPWGGGNQFASSLKAFLLHQGVEVVHALADRDIDLILLVEPRGSLKISAFTDIDIIRYLLHKNSRAIVVHRINECDERKGTKSLNQLLFYANRCADHTVFISDWLRRLFTGQWKTPGQHSVIFNGAASETFNTKSHIRWNGRGRLKLVTHHWGGNRMKGFDIYEHLDSLIGTNKYREKISFTYIGGLPKGFSFKNSEHIKPLAGKELARCLADHHIYVTGSQNEPAGMHHIEGAICGLPVLYRNSGALPDYCNGYGVMFDETNFESKLDEMLSDYDSWADSMNGYSYTAGRMCNEYFVLFRRLLEERDSLIARRNRHKLDGYMMMLRSGLFKYRHRMEAYFG